MMESNTKEYIQVSHVSKQFTSAQAGKKVRVDAVCDVSLRLEKGETLGIIGTSGCGKTTLVRMILGLLRPDGGEISKNGTIGFVSQDPYTSLDPSMTVRQLVGEPFVFLKKKGKAQKEQLVDSALRMVRLEPEIYGGRLPSKLSGGERQRVNIARAMVLQPDFLILDEPTSMLDEEVKGEILDVIAGIERANQCGVLLITHDIMMSAQVCSRLLVMENGRVVEEGSREQVLKHPRNPFTRKLILAATDLDEFWRQAGALNGEMSGETRQ